MKRTPLKRKRSPKRPDDDPEHLDKLRKFGCWCCWVDGDGWRPSEPHHPRVGGKDGPGMGQRAPDRDAIPLCPDRHHNVQTRGYLSIHRNPIEFRERYGTEAEIRDQVLKIMEEDYSWPRILNTQSNQAKP